MLWRINGDTVYEVGATCECIQSSSLVMTLSRYVMEVFDMRKTQILRTFWAAGSGISDV